MKKKIFCFAISLFLVSVFVVTGGPAQEETVEPGEQTKSAVAAPPGQDPAKWSGLGEMPPMVKAGEGGYSTGPPEYGGTLTIFNDSSKGDPGSPAIMDGVYMTLHNLEWMYEKLIQGDFEKYGPRGTGEHWFRTFSYQPEIFMRGHLLEDWDISLEKMVLHVRPGIYWAGTNAVKKVMEDRELVAQDMVDHIRRFIESPWGGRFDGLITAEGVNVVDKYTWEVAFENYSHSVWYYIGYEDRAQVRPTEVEKAGAHLWENQVGTGAWKFEEYVVGSHMSYVRNDNYWKTTVIDGVEYELPFIDRIVQPFIPDYTTSVAALRTGKLDIHRIINPPEVSSIEKAGCPVYAAWVQDKAVSFRCDEPPFNDVNVRRAMSIGTNRKRFQRIWEAEGTPVHHWPWGPSDPGAYIPLEELPEDIQILYEYNPELAKQMLADAGYPNGFTTEAIVITTPINQDNASLLKDQWSDIGVEVKIDAVDEMTMRSRWYARPPVFSGVFMDQPSIISNPPHALEGYYETGATWGVTMYDNPKINEISDAINVELDADKRNELAKEAALILLREAPVLPLTLYPRLWAIWPWVKNYFGEFTLHDCTHAEQVPYWWIDEKLKTTMGF